MSRWEGSAAHAPMQYSNLLGWIRRTSNIASEGRIRSTYRYVFFLNQSDGSVAHQSLDFYYVWLFCWYSSITLLISAYLFIDFYICPYPLLLKVTTPTEIRCHQAVSCVLHDVDCLFKIVITNFSEERSVVNFPNANHPCLWLVRVCFIYFVLIFTVSVEKQVIFQ